VAEPSLSSGVIGYVLALARAVAARDFFFRFLCFRKWTWQALTKCVCAY